MFPDRGSSVVSMLARYKALLQAEQTGPPNPERHAQLQALAEYLRAHHATLLAEAQKQVQAAHEAIATAKAKQQSAASGASAKAATTESPQPESPPPGVRYIDPHLAEKLRSQLFQSLS